MLVDGGDSRLVLDPIAGVNRYGCGPSPDPDLAAFGSSTASTISDAGFAAADAVRERLLRASATAPPALTYARELQRLRGELIELCGLADLGIDVLFAASGTDLHAIAGQLFAGDAVSALRVITVEPRETGSGVPAALALAGAGSEVVAVAARGADGAARSATVVAAEVEALVAAGVDAGRRVLVVVTDVSKTGLLSPALDGVLDLQRRWGAAVDFLVDACQFRLAPATLRAYLQHGFMLAVTGSKFLTGPAFSGALLVPPSTARRLRTAKPRPQALGGSLRAEWPRGWAAAASLPDDANYGLLLRWQAALAELRAFRTLPEGAVAAFAADFGRAIQNRLSDDPHFEALAVPALDRRALLAAPSWDRLPTIFPFILRRGRADPGAHLDRAASEQVYRRLRAFRCQVGQPVPCGERDGPPLAALRLCLSARLIVEAVRDGRRSAVIERALAVLDKAAVVVHSLG